MKRKPRLLIGFLVFLALLWLAGCFLLVQPVLFSAARAKTGADPARLKNDVRTLSENFHPRDYRHPENLDRCAAWLRGEFDNAGATVREQAFETGGRTYRNVIARYGSRGGGLVVVGAHYDAFQDTPGADDNASGVAGLLELARLLGRHPATRDIELVAYTLEEPPFFRTADMGSAHHARELKAGGTPIRGVMILVLSRP